MQQTKNIFLIGFMASGKSTLGRMIAEKKGWQFVDMDNIIEKEEKMTVQQIFAQKGEEYFRKAENKVLMHLCQGDKLVVATGGGVPCFMNNLELMNTNGISVYLKLSPEALLKRLTAIPIEVRALRPLLANKDDAQLMEYIQNTLNIREPIYSKARWIVDNEDSPPIVLGRIEKLMDLGGF